MQLQHHPASAASRSRASTAICRAASRRDHEDPAPGVKTSYFAKLRHPQRLPPLSRAGQFLKLCFSRRKKEASGSLLSVQPCEKWGRCRNNGIGCRCSIGLQLASDYDHDGMQEILSTLRDETAHTSFLAKREKIQWKVWHIHTTLVERDEKNFCAGSSRANRSSIRVPSVWRLSAFAMK